MFAALQRFRPAIRIALTLLGLTLGTWALFSFVVSDAELVLGYVEALAWPIVVSVVLYWLRAPLQSKFAELMRFDAFGTSARFSPRDAEALDEDIREPAARLRSGLGETDIDASIDEVVRKSALWGYELGRENADTAEAQTHQRPRGARPHESETSASPNERSIEKLEDEIKSIEHKTRTNVLGFGQSAADYLWLRELKRRLGHLDPDNPWAQDL
ncbi:MAG: hypothetical protein M1337_04740 [Actinobacteria bacterium]|nr:hypothetical protein [Actinomycetota bacterium]